MNTHHAIRSFLGLVMAFCMLLPGVAQKKSAKVQKLERERQEIMKALQKTEKDLKKVRNDKSQKQKEVNLLSKQVKQRAALVAALDAEIKGFTQEIDSLLIQEKSLQQEETRRKADYERTLLALQNRKNSTDRMLFVLSADDFDQAVRRMRFMGQYSVAHSMAAQQLKATREALEETRRTIESHRSRKSTLLVKREKEKKKLEKDRDKRSQEVTSLKGKESQLQGQIKKQQKQIQALDNRIKQQIAAEIAEAQKKAAQKGSDRKAATKGGYPMTAEERKLSGSFAQNKGNLPAPVNANYRIVGTFGVQQHDELSRVQTNNNGIDIEVPKGSSARAVFEGTVTSIFIIEGSRAAIIVRHGNYLTVYSNVTNVVVKKGQKVTAHQVLGKVATDSYTDKAILNFQVWHERNKQNPRIWIR